MIVKFKKGIDKEHPNVWSSSNLFYGANKRIKGRKKQFKTVIKILKERGFAAEIREFAPNNWDFTVHAVCLDLDAAQEAYFIIFANDGIEI
jgi:hypothetical protein